MHVLGVRPNGPTPRSSDDLRSALQVEVAARINTILAAHDANVLMPRPMHPFF